MEEVNLSDNWIGDAGGTELVLALQERRTGIYICNKLSLAF